MRLVVRLLAAASVLAGTASLVRLFLRVLKAPYRSQSWSGVC